MENLKITIAGEDKGWAIIDGVLHFLHKNSTTGKEEYAPYLIEDGVFLSYDTELNSFSLMEEID